jgi:hypothetical protein
LPAYNGGMSELKAIKRPVFAKYVLMGVVVLALIAVLFAYLDMIGAEKVMRQILLPKFHG